MGTFLKSFPNEPHRQFIFNWEGREWEVKIGRITIQVSQSKELARPPSQQTRWEYVSIISAMQKAEVNRNFRSSLKNKAKKGLGARLK
jgi:hypothetical protein